MDRWSADLGKGLHTEPQPLFQIHTTLEGPPCANAESRDMADIKYSL